MEPKDLMKEVRGNGEEFALFLDHLKQLSIFMRKVISSDNKEETEEVLEDKLKDLKKHGRKAKKMEGNEDVDLFSDIVEDLERTIRFSLLESETDLDLSLIFKNMSSSFDNLKKIYGMRGEDTVKSVKLARDVEDNCGEAKERCYEILDGVLDEEFERELTRKLLDIIYELEFLSDNFITSVDSQIK